MLQFNIRNTVKPTLSNELANALRRAGQDTAVHMKRRLEEITSDWHNEPEFVVTSSLESQRIQLSVLTDSPIYNFVDKGVRPHRIPKSGKKRMRIKRPGQAPFFTSVVNHPGIKAKDYSNQVAREVLPTLSTKVAAQLRRQGIK